MSRKNPNYLEKDYYACLGVQSAATELEIKKAYRRLALKWHPDRKPDDPDALKFKAISEAYEVLSDTETKADYDVQSPFGYKPPSVSTPVSASERPQSQSMSRVSAASDFSWPSFWQPALQLVSIAASLTFLLVSVASVVATRKVSSRNASFSLMGLFVLWQNRAGLEELMNFNFDSSATAPTV